MKLTLNEESLDNAKEVRYSEEEKKRINKRAGIPPNPAELGIPDSLYDGSGNSACTGECAGVTSGCSEGKEVCGKLVLNESRGDMLYCPNCGEVFSADDAEQREHADASEYWGSIVYERSTELLCPYCGHGDLEDASECEICGEYFGPDELDGNGRCSECSKQEIDDYLVSDECREELRKKFGSDYYKRPICHEVCDYIHDELLWDNNEEKVVRESVVFGYDVEIEKGGVQRDVWDTITRNGHSVILCGDKIYDFTAGQWNRKYIKDPQNVVVLSYDDKLSKRMGGKVYRNGNYCIAI